MNAKGSAGRIAGIVVAVATLLLAHSAAADDSMTVYGKRMTKPEAAALAQPAVDTAGLLATLHDDLRASIHEDIRASLRDGFSALRVEIAEGREAANDIQVAAVAARAGG